MIRKQVGKRIRMLRKLSKMSQEEFAFRCGMDRTYITSLENGKRNISIVNLKKIAEVFEMTLSEFFDLEDLEDFNDIR